MLARHQVEARLSLEIDLAQRHPGAPISLAPDAWLGLTDRWTVGVIHSSQSVDRIEAGASLCIRQSEGLDRELPGSCERPYRGGGVEARWSWRAGAPTRASSAGFRDSLSIAPRVRLLVRDVDPGKPATTLGALVRWTRGRFAITSDPYLQLGLANRDRGNRAAFVLPVWFAVQPTCRWQLALHTGVNGDLAVWRDGWHVPIAFAVIVRPTAQLDVGVEAGFPQLLGPQNDYKQRALIVTVGWRSLRAW